MIIIELRLKRKVRFTRVIFTKKRHYASNKALTNVIIPLKIKNIAAPHTTIPTTKTGINKGLSWLLKAEKSTEGPRNNKGSEMAKNLTPFAKSCLFVCF